MPFDVVSLLERPQSRMLPYRGHITRNAVLLKNDAVLAMGRLHGRPHELADEAETYAAAASLAGLWRQEAAENLTVCAHLVRRKTDEMLPPPAFRNRFSTGLRGVYDARVLSGKLFSNEWFLSTVLSPRSTASALARGERWKRLAKAMDAPVIDTTDDLLAATDHIWQTFGQALAGYDLRRLSLRSRRGVLFSEIGEALRAIVYADSLPSPLCSGHLGDAVATDRLVFGPRPRHLARRMHRVFELHHPDRIRYGAVFGLRHYPDRTRPGMFDAVLSLPCELVFSQSFTFLARDVAEKRLSTKSRHMVNAGDRALSQVEDINKRGGARDQLMSGEWVMGAHSLALAIYSDSLAELPHLAALARTKLAESGATIVQESVRGGMESAVYAQLPGNTEWQPRPAAITSANFADMNGFCAFPRGAKSGRWGPAMVRFRTTAGTAFDYIPHVNDDVGMLFMAGHITSGKSTLLVFMLAMFDQYMAGNDGLIFLFDKDRGSEIAVNAMDGRYVVIKSGEDSGLNPLRGLANTAADREFLTSWIKRLIELDGQGGIEPDDEARIARGVAAIMRMPLALRSLGGLRQFLASKNPVGAGARLERWCNEGSLGWCFDGERDEIDIGNGAGIVGFDLAAILDHEEIVNPAALYLLHRIRSLMDGRRVVIALDEFRKYITHKLFREMTEDFLLTARKNNAIVILVTQQPEHVLTDTFGATLVGQCQTMMFFPTPTADETVYREKLFLTPGEIQAIRQDMQPGSRRVLIRRTGDQTESVIVDFDLASMPEYVAVLSGRRNTIVHAEKLRRGPRREWLSQFMQTYHEARD